MTYKLYVPDEKYRNPSRDGQLINDLLNATIFLNAENEHSLISQKWFEKWQFRQNFWHTGSVQSPLPLFPKIVFPPILAAILNFSVKCKKKPHIYLRNVLIPQKQFGKELFYCTTIAYHVELNANSEAAGIRPTSKKNRHLVLAIASGCTLVELFSTHPPFLIGHMIWKRLLCAVIFYFISKFLHIVG